MKLFPQLSGLMRKLVLAIAFVVTFAIIGYVAVYVVATVQSAPVTIFNDTAHAVIIPDCGSDLTQIDAGQTATLSDYTNTRTFTERRRYSSRSRLTSRKCTTRKTCNRVLGSPFLSVVTSTEKGRGCICEQQFA
jgi:hypothetical protein